MKVFICVLIGIGVMACAAASQADDAPLTIHADKDDSKIDRQKELQNLFDRAARTGRRVRLPAGTFLHSGVLVMNGIKVSGAGAATILQGTTRNSASVILTGDGAKLTGLKLTFPATTRSDADESSLVLVRQAQDFTVSNLTMDGSDSAGIFVLDSSRGVITRNDISNTLADSIHMTGGSSDIRVTDNTTHFSGDDGIAAVSYEKYSKLVRHIRILHNTILDNKYARGISVVGGNDVDIADNFVRCTQGYAGIYIASEESYHTYGASNVTVRGNTVRNCGSPWIGHGAVMIYNGYHDNDHIAVIGNTITDSPGAGITVRGRNNLAIALKDNIILRSGTKPIAQEGPSEHVDISGNTTEEQTPSPAPNIR